MYCKCGDADYSRLVFDMMPCKSTVIWTQMLHSYARNGRGDAAVNLFKDMIQSKVKPDCITFVAVLTACSHSGLVDTGLRLFESMQQEYEIAPLSEHYTCVVDMLGRAGRFDKLQEIIEQMQYKDEPIVWEVLLSSCRIHANVKLAERAADELFRLLDGNGSASYALLANTYSSVDMWDNVRDVRGAMDQRKVEKEPS